MAQLRGIPAQYTTDVTIATGSQLRLIERALKITAADYVGQKYDPEDQEDFLLLREIRDRKAMLVQPRGSPEDRVGEADVGRL